MMSAALTLLVALLRVTPQMVAKRIAVSARAGSR
jgi:hypothetical protein